MTPAFSLSFTHSVVFIQTCAYGNTVMNKSWASVCVQQLALVSFLFEYQTGGVCYSQTIIYKYKYIYIYQLLERKRSLHRYGTRQPTPGAETQTSGRKNVANERGRHKIIGEGRGHCAALPCKHSEVPWPCHRHALTHTHTHSHTFTQFAYIWNKHM